MPEEALCDGHRPHIILFGDGNSPNTDFNSTNANRWSQGLRWFLKEKYEGKAQIVSRGTPGCTSRQLRPELDHVISQINSSNGLPVPLFILFLGACDAWIPEAGRGEDTENVPLDEFESNICGFLDTILAETKMKKTKIILITPPPIDIRDSYLMDFLAEARISLAKVGRDPNDEYILPAAVAGVKAAIRQEQRWNFQFPALNLEPDTNPKETRGYRTYMSRKRYADSVMTIAN